MLPAHSLRVRGLLVLAALPFVVGVSTTAAEPAAAKCSPIPQRTNIEPRSFTLVCASGRATVNAASGVSYVFSGGRCYYGPGGARLNFGGLFGSPTAFLGIVVETPRAGGSRRAEISDGVLQLPPAGRRRPFALVGTARLTDGFRRGTFTVVEHLGAGTTGKTAFTGSWNCAGRRSLR